MAISPRQYLELQKRIERFAIDLTGNSTPPQIVWHYTTAIGLIGILESGYIRGTNYSFMNDASEFNYGRNVAERALKHLIDQGAGQKKDFFRCVTKSLDNFTSSSEIYLACFSQKGNDLSQWRGYSAGHDRFSLGFEAQKLKESRAVMRAMTYEMPAQETQLQQFLSAAWVALATPFSDESDLIKIADMLVPHLFDILCFYKDASFRDEQEWRVAKRLNVEDTSSISFCSNDSGLQAYVPLCGKPGQRLPLATLRFLSTHPERAEKFARMILHKHGHTAVELQRSDVPFIV